MTSVSALERSIFLVSISGHLLLLAKLSFTRLFRIYRWFSAYIAFQLVTTIVLLFLNPSTNIFGYVWIPARLGSYALYFLVVYELYALVLKDYPGIQRLGQRAMLVAVALSLLVAGSSLIVDLNAQPDRYPILKLVYTVGRGVTFSLVLFIAMMVGFLAYFPVPLKSNVVTHAALNVIYFLLASLGVFYRNLVGQGFARTLSMTLGALTAVLLYCWFFRLSQAGEERVRSTGIRWDRGAEMHLLDQLKTINNSLLHPSVK
jgi:hypothetical protein